MLRPLQILAMTLCLLPSPAARAQCPGDVDGDGAVGINDFLALLGAWGSIGGPADLDNDGVVGIQDFLLLLGNWGPCPIPAPYPAPPTIVVYNENYPDLDGNGVNDALEIAEYYVSSRGLDASALCGVRLPTGDYATPAELLGARATVVEDCICSFVSQEVQQSSGCDLANPGALESIRDGSPITHMVLIKGIPVRLFAVNWSDQGDTDKQGPSFGFYLSYLVYHAGDIFADSDLIESLSYPMVSESTLGYVPPINPAQHRMLAYGYVEGMTTQRAVALIEDLARRYGPRAAVWRYDPLLITSLTPPAWHRRTFTRLARAISGSVDEVVFSFAHIYAKTKANLTHAAGRHGFTWDDPPEAEKRALLADLAGIARGFGLHPTLCAQPEFLGPGIEPARCIDAARLSDLAGRPLGARTKGNRPGCLCAESRDIGAYDSCPHGCVYCYAVRKPGLAKRGYRAHDPDSPFLIAPQTAGTAGAGAAD